MTIPVFPIPDTDRFEKLAREALEVLRTTTLDLETRVDDLEQGGGGGGIPKLDDCLAPDDNTDLNASVSGHGLLSKLSGNGDEFLNGLGNWSNPISSHDHNDLYYTETEIDDLLAEKSDDPHSHDDRYYTETEIDTQMSNKEDTGHNHDDRYYLESEINSLLDNLAVIGHNHNTLYSGITHGSNHHSGGSDAIKLDDLDAPDDNTDLDASQSAHGLLPKLSSLPAEFLNGEGNWAIPEGSGGGGDSGVSTNFKAYEIVGEYELNNKILDETLTNLHGENVDEILFIEYSYISGIADTTFAIQFNDDSNANYRSGYLGEYNDSANAQHGESDINCMYVNWSNANQHIAGNSKVYLKSGQRRLCLSNTVAVDDINSNYHHLSYRTAWKNTTDEVTKMRIFTDVAITGTIRVYKFKKVNLPVSTAIPSNFKAYEVVGEYELTDGFDQTIEIDGEAYPDIIIEAAYDNPTSNWRGLALNFNGDTANNYKYKYYGDGTDTATGGAASLGAAAPNSTHNFSQSRLQLKKDLKRIVVCESSRIASDFSTAWYKYISSWNATDAVTKMNITLTGSGDISGYVKVYALKKVDLPEPRGTEAVGIQSIKVEYVDASTIKVNQGVVHIKSGSYDDIYQVRSEFNKALSNPNSDAWYYIYAKVPSEGHIQAVDIEYSTTPPIEYDYGYYHDTNTDWRCIGIIRTNDSGEIIEYDYSVNEILWNISIGGVNCKPSTTWTDYQLVVPPVSPICIATTWTHRYSSSNNTAYWRKKGTDSSGIFLGYQGSNPAGTQTTTKFVCDSSGYIQVKYSESSTDSIWVYAHGFVLNEKFYTGFTQIKAKEVFNRGAQSIKVEYKDADEIYINPGSAHIKGDTSEEYYTIQSQIAKQLTDLTADSWYYIYIKPPASGYTITATEIEYSTDAPARDIDKVGYYHGTNTDWRCIGAIFTDNGSNILKFYNSTREVKFEKDVANISAAPGNTWTDYTLSVPLFDALCCVRFYGYYGNSSTTGYYRVKGSAENGVSFGVVRSNYVRCDVMTTVPSDSTGTIQLRWDNTNNGNIILYCRGFTPPDEIYNGPQR